MGQLTFFRALIEHGRVRVDPPELGGQSQLIADAESAETGQALAEWEVANRLDFPGEAPPLSPAGARWALAQLHAACRFAVYRDVESSQIEEALNIPCPSAAVESQHYSVDLLFRFLPDLYRLTKSASQDDPLCTHLRRWAVEWPLSSVGMPGLEAVDPSAVVEHAGLLRLYVDRIIARRDVSRLGNPRVCAAVRAAIGDFDDLAPQIAAAVRKLDDSDREPSTA